ncbi:hypothetical protein ACHAXN_010506 [Cyclotella atomus]
MAVVVPSISGLDRVDWLSRRSLVGFGAGPRDCEASLGLGAATSNIDVDATSLGLGAAARDIDSVSLVRLAARDIQSASFFTLAAGDIDSVSLVRLGASARGIQSVSFFTLAARDIDSISLVGLRANQSFLTGAGRGSKASPFQAVALVTLAAADSRDIDSITLGTLETSFGNVDINQLAVTLGNRCRKGLDLLLVAFILCAGSKGSASKKKRLC